MRRKIQEEVTVQECLAARQKALAAFEVHPPNKIVSNHIIKHIKKKRVVQSAIPEHEQQLKTSIRRLKGKLKGVKGGTSTSLSFNQVDAFAKKIGGFAEIENPISSRKGYKTENEKLAIIWRKYHPESKKDNEGTLKNEDIQKYLTKRVEVLAIQSFKKAEPTDEVWEFDYHPCPLCGCFGLTLVRNKKVVEFIIQGMY